MINTIIFDCDGVVLNTSPAWLESSRILLARRDIVYEPQKIRHFLTGKTLLDSTKIMKEFYNLAGTTEEITAERFTLVAGLLEKEVTFVPGFIEFMSKISGKYKVSMATSMKPALFEIAEKRLNIKKLFSHHIYFGEDLKDASKPKPDIFLHAAKMTGSRPENCLVIEDAPNGIQAAKNAGMKSIGITTTFKPDLLKEADQIVDIFEQIDLKKF